jgi:hypothetical protein
VDDVSNGVSDGVSNDVNDGVYDDNGDNGDNGDSDERNDDRITNMVMNDEDNDEG